MPKLKYGPGSVASSDDEEEAEMKSQLKSGSEAAASSDEDEEANEDLSLKIVEKALLMRAAKLASDSDPFNRVSSDDSDDEDDVGDGAEVVELHKGKALMEKGEDLIEETVARPVNAGNIPQQHNETTIIAAEEKGKVAVAETKDAAESMDLNVVETADNLVLRKLLRGARYFDPLSSSSQACFNCGEEGHAAANCIQKRKRPCFCCGSLEHKSKDCRKEKCFVCNTNGHKARDCPEKKNQGIQADKICLKCGISGHEMISCGYNYSPEDLKEIQCYVCQNLGHLCCVDSVDDNRSEISCYRCGLLGHDGSGCNAVSIANKAEATPSLCFKCGEKGHFARECIASFKSGNRFQEGTQNEETPSLCYKCGQEGHYARECTVLKKRSTSLSNGHQDEATPSSCYKCGEVGHFARECSQVHKRNPEPSTPVARFYERDRDFYSGSNSHSHSKNSSKRKHKSGIDGSASKSQKKKSRGGWITEEPETPKFKKYAKNNGWMSRGSNFNGTEPDFYSPSPSWRQNSRYGESSQHGSRFSNSRSESSRRNYDWW